MRDLFALNELINEYLKADETIDSKIINELKNITYNNKYIGIAQINTIPGNIEYNAKKITNYIKISEKIGLELVAFPELALIGMPLQDTISRHPVITENCYKWLKGIAKFSNNTISIVGFMEFAGNNKYYNSIAILHKGTIQGIVRKNSVNFNLRDNDCKYQCPSNDICITAGNNEKTPLYNDNAILIGDDLSLYENLEKLLNYKPKLVINPASNNYKQNRELLKNNTLSHTSKKYNIVSVYINQVGANDNVLYDGISSVYNSKGELLARAKAFEEQLLIVNPYENIGKIYDLPSGFDEYLSNKNSFSLDYENDMERIYNALILGVKDYFNKCGFKRAVLGLSGGLDSTVCAVILADAIGENNVYGVSMPSHITSNESKTDAELLAHNLGINFIEAPIRTMIDTATNCFNNIFNSIEFTWENRYQKSYTQDNIQARSRAMILWGISNEFPSCIPIATSDKSEAYMGYATINGDMSGGFAPIADITKTKLFALARWMNKYRKEKNTIPESIIIKKPGAELAIDPKTGKPLIAEDALMPYEFLDEIIWRIENKQENYNEMLNSAFEYEKHNIISKEQKIEWLNKFYARMSKAFYKWSIMPPFVAIEPHSINKCDYIQPITSSGINYKEIDEEYINEYLN